MTNKAKPTLGARIESARLAIVYGKGEKFAGLRFIDTDGEHYTFKPRSRQLRVALSNLDRQDPDAFEVFTNLNNEVAVRQIKWTPMFYLI